MSSGGLSPVARVTIERQIDRQTDTDRNQIDRETEQWECTNLS